MFARKIAPLSEPNFRQLEEEIKRIFLTCHREVLRTQAALPEDSALIKQYNENLAKLMELSPEAAKKLLNQLHKEVMQAGPDSEYNQET